MTLDGKNVNDRFDERLGLGLPNRVDDVDVAGRQRDARAGFREIDDRQTDEERRRRDDLEKDERFDSDPADFFQRTGAGDSDDDGRENKRRDDRLDQVDENVAEKINFVSPIGPQPTDQCADDETDHDLRGQRRSIPRAAMDGTTI